MTRDEKVRSLAMILAALDDDRPDEGWRSARYTTLARLIVDQLVANQSIIVYNADPNAAKRLRQVSAGRARWRRWFA
jgi:hypothetical protein